jgi:hypothetical protein
MTYTIELVMHRYNLIDKANAMGITLDGQIAAMVGARNTYGVVRLLSGKGGDVEYSWPAIERILAKGGAFVS